LFYRVFAPASAPEDNSVMNVSLSIGKIRGLQQIAGSRGVFTMAAMDHRGSLEHGLCPLPGTGCYDDMVEFKLDLCRSLSPLASAVLLDPIYGAAQAVARAALPRGTGLLVSVEATGYEGGKTARITKILEDWGADKIKRLGADAVKMLVYFRPDSGDLAKKQLATVEQVAGDCLKYDIPFLVEPVGYALEGESAADFAAKKTNIVVETARLMTALPIDVLKAEFPADMTSAVDEDVLMKACRELDAASARPWVILSAGAEYDIFRRQVELACRAGASGFLAGRAIWQEAVAMNDREERKKFLETTAVGRLAEISAIAEKWARPWHQKLGLVPDGLSAVDAEWHWRYQGLSHH
jgi:tagatose 1,6-diphosphate aldolase